MLRRLQEANLENKRVLLRVDFNVSVKNGVLGETFKIHAARETIGHVMKQEGSKLVLLTHLGRPGGVIKDELSVKHIIPGVEKILGLKVKFVSKISAGSIQEALGALSSGEILLLENVRFYPGEKTNDSRFAQELGNNFNVFVNDAFGVCHRNQTSVTEVAKILLSYAGLHLQKEIEQLNKVKMHPEHPAVAIIGGAKIETKLPVIKFFQQKYDRVLVGGKIANEAIDRRIEFSDKVVLPSDFADENRFDIGEETQKKFLEIISTARTIVWNGPLGKFEEERYARGSREVLRAVISSGAFTLVGGGETVELLEEQQATDKINFVSTGGGAMLDFLAGSPMPGIEALKF